MLIQQTKKNPLKIKMWKKIVLVLPVLISISLIFCLNYQSSLPIQSGAELLAPVDSTPLMVSLIIFTIGYVLFLLLMFSEEIKEFFKKEVKH